MFRSDDMSQLPNSAHQLLTNLTPITIDGQTVYIAQVRSDTNYAISNVGNIVTAGNIVTSGNLASMQPPICPASAQQNVVVSNTAPQGNVLVQSNLPIQSGVVSVSSANVAMATTVHKQEPVSVSSPPSYMKGVSLQGHKVYNTQPELI